MKVKAWLIAAIVVIFLASYQRFVVSEAGANLGFKPVPHQSGAGQAPPELRGLGMSE